MRISEQTYRRIVGFVRKIASDCTACLRRCDANCENCRSMWANSILTDIEADSEGVSNRIDYSLGARVERILESLRSASGPLLSQEIDLGNTCSRQLKQWTLNKLVRRGIVGRKVFAHSKKKTFYKYYLRSRKDVKILKAIKSPTTGE